MKRELTDQEIKVTVDKIREKYRKIITDFKKSNAILEAFEDRYMRVLKSHIDISVFLLAEIEVVDEIYKKEEDKQKQKAMRLQAKKNIKTGESFADKVMQENFDRITKYELVPLSKNADEEIERLLGAVRFLLISYWPALLNITKNIYENSIAKIFNDYYHNLVINYDYKECPPIAKSYKYALESMQANNKRVETERYHIIKETAFLLNDILKSLNELLKEENPSLETKMKIDQTDKILKANFENLSYKEALLKVKNYIYQILIDFRIRDLKR